MAKFDFSKEFGGDHDSSDRLTLDDGSRVAVVGGGPAGSFFSFFLLKMAESVGLQLEVDIYEPRHFTQPGPGGCNHCGGIVSESLVQLLATEGINIPPTVVQRGIDSYVLHMDVGSVRIDTPLTEKRIAAVFRGIGPRGIMEIKWDSFDNYLLQLAEGRGARVIRQMVNEVDWSDGRPMLGTPDGTKETYDFLAITTGINSNFRQLIEGNQRGYKAPRTAKTFICEFLLGEETIQKHMGTSMHVFLLDLPRLEFAALVPKGDYVTMVMLGHDIDDILLKRFLASPEVRQCFPSDEIPRNWCYCLPRINTGGTVQPFGDRMVMIGDCGVTRLYKDGIGAAYRMAKSAAAAAVFQGISADDFRNHYGKSCRAMATDNLIGKLIFTVNGIFQKTRFTRRGVFRMTLHEQIKTGRKQHMSTVLWDLFTGSAPYREVFFRTLNPAFFFGFVWNTAVSLWPFHRPAGNWRKP